MMDGLEIIEIDVLVLAIRYAPLEDIRHLAAERSDCGSIWLDSSESLPFGLLGSLAIALSYEMTGFGLLFTIPKSPIA